MFFVKAVKALHPGVKTPAYTFVYFFLCVRTSVPIGFSALISKKKREILHALAVSPGVCDAVLVAAQHHLP